MDNPILIDKYKDELGQWINRMRKDGIREEVIHSLLEITAQDSEMRIVAQSELGEKALNHTIDFTDTHFRSEF